MSAPNLKEIEWAIQELEQEESSFDVYAKLANLYTVRKELMDTSNQGYQPTTYSEASGPTEERLGQYGDSNFMRAISGKDPAQSWAVIDELMDTLQIVNPRAYESVIRKLNKI